MANQITEFGGEERFAASPEKLYELLTNLDAMASSIPDLVSAEKVDGRTMKCVVRPRFSFLRGTMRLTITLAEASEPRLDQSRRRPGHSPRLEPGSQATRRVNKPRIFATKFRLARMQAVR
ncbi:MAG: hypothetical protein HY288_08565 [Planctomycetia bacterium]|nr:hypothetical protein [Planctomycetia bacterium]